MTTRALREERDQAGVGWRYPAMQIIAKAAAGCPPTGV
jgi:hypothetical protein